LCGRFHSRHCRYNIIPKEFQYEFLSCRFQRTSVLTFRNVCVLYLTLFSFVRKHCLAYISIKGLPAGQIEEVLCNVVGISCHYTHLCPKRVLGWKPIGRRIRERSRKRWTEDVEEDIQRTGIRGWRKLCKERTEWKRNTEKAKTHSGL